jgi:hypothetical protein
MAKPVPTGAKFITVPQLCERWGGLSHMFVERRLREDPNFPKPQRLGRLRVFDVPTIEAYERSLVTIKYARKKAKAA